MDFRPNDTMESTYNLESETLGSGLTRPILSRRRKGKGSSIVLSSQRLSEINLDDDSLHKFNSTHANISHLDNSTGRSLIYDGEPNVPNHRNVAWAEAHAVDSKRKSVLQRLSTERVMEVETKMHRRRLSANAIQRAWRSLLEWRSFKLSKPIYNIGKETELGNHRALKIAAKLKIIKAWKKYRQNLSLMKYLQHGKWAKSTADKIFARIVLGRRVRYLFSSRKVKGLINSIKDILRVIEEIMSASEIFLIEDTELTISKIHRGLYRHSVPGVSASDFLLLQNLSRQIFVSKKLLKDYLFHDAIWEIHPSPGYWDLSNAVQQARFENSHAVKNAKALFPPRDSVGAPGRTPPRLKTPTKDITPAKTLSGGKPQVSLWTGVSSAVSPQLVASKTSNDSMNMTMSSEDDTMNYSQQSIHYQPTTKDTASTMTSVSRRGGPKAHIQLDILSAERLMPAKKGSIARDASGDIVPDRRPCLKVTLYLPQIVDSASEKIEMKKIKTWSRDSTEISLHPRWEKTLKLPLMCPKHILLSNLNMINESINRKNYDDIVVNSKCYESICNALVDWWGMGFIKVEVVDGERFNEEIFLGETTFLLSSFILPYKRKQASQHATNRDNKPSCSIEVEGQYPLNKILPTDRVSGSISMHAYLHLPEPQYLANLITLLQKSSRIPGSIVTLSKSLDIGIDSNSVHLAGNMPQSSQKSPYSENPLAAENELESSQNNKVSTGKRFSKVALRRLSSKFKSNLIGSAAHDNSISNDNDNSTALALNLPVHNHRDPSPKSPESKKSACSPPLSPLESSMSSVFTDREASSFSVSSSVSIDHPVSYFNIKKKSKFSDLIDSTNAMLNQIPMVSNIRLTPPIANSPDTKCFKPIAGRGFVGHGHHHHHHANCKESDPESKLVSQSASGHSRRNKLVSLSKCLDDLSWDMQNTADVVIGDLSRKLDERRESKLHIPSSSIR